MRTGHIPSSLSVRPPSRRRRACFFLSLISLASMFFFFSCNGNSGGSDFEGPVYGGGSSSEADGGSTGQNDNSLSAWDIMNLANQNNTDEIVSRLTDNTEEEEAKTFTVTFGAADLQLPAGGWVVLEIEGDGIRYKEKAYASADGILYFTVPTLPIRSMITVTLSAYDSEGNPYTSGYKTELVEEGGTTSISVPLTNLPPLPVISFAGNGNPNSNTVEQGGVMYTVMEYTGDSLGMTVTNSDPSSTLEVELNGSTVPASTALPDGFCTITATVTKSPALPSVVSTRNVYVVKKLAKPVITRSGGTLNGKSTTKDGKTYTVIEYSGSLPSVTVTSSYDGDNAATGSSTLTVTDNGTTMAMENGSPVSASVTLSEGYNAIEATLSKEHCTTVTEEEYFYVVKALVDPVITFPNGTAAGTSGGYAIYRYSYLSSTNYDNLLVSVSNSNGSGSQLELSVGGATYTGTSSINNKIVSDGQITITATVTKDLCTTVKVEKKVKAEIKPVTVSVSQFWFVTNFSDADGPNDVYGTVSLGKNGGEYQTLYTFSNEQCSNGSWKLIGHNGVTFTLSSKTDSMSYKSEGMYESDSTSGDDDIGEVSTSASLSTLASTKRSGGTPELYAASGGEPTEHRIYLNLSD